MRDGNFLTGGQWCINFTNNIYSAVLVKFDIDGNMLWRQVYNVAGLSNSVGFLHERADKSINLAGRIDKSDAFIQLQFIEATSTGSLVRITLIGSKRIMDEAESCRSMKRTQDGGFIFAAGYIYDPAPTPFSIIKIDSQGCDTVQAFCRSSTVGLKETIASEENSLRIFPNPADRQINVVLSSSSVQDLTFTIQDVSGRTVRSQTLIAGEVSGFDVSGLAAGVYLCKIIESSRVIGIRKLSIVR